MISVIVVEAMSKRSIDERGVVFSAVPQIVQGPVPIVLRAKLRRIVPISCLVAKTATPRQSKIASFAFSRAFAGTEPKSNPTVNSASFEDRSGAFVSINPDLQEPVSLLLAAPVSAIDEAIFIQFSDKPAIDNFFDFDAANLWIQQGHDALDIAQGIGRRIGLFLNAEQQILVPFFRHSGIRHLHMVHNGLNYSGFV